MTALASYQKTKRTDRFLMRDSKTVLVKEVLTETMFTTSTESLVVVIAMRMRMGVPA